MREGTEEWENITNGDAIIKLMVRNLQSMDGALQGYTTEGSYLTSNDKSVKSLTNFIWNKVKFSVNEHNGGGPKYSSQVIEQTAKKKMSIYVLIV